MLNLLNIKSLNFNRQEIKDIAVSTLILAFVFFYGNYGYTLIQNIGQTAIYSYLLYLTIVALAFIPHELAHRFTAMHYGYMAKYQIWWKGLKIAIILAIITNGNFVIAAPGAVMIYSQKIDIFGRTNSTITQKENAHISIAGPAANLTIAALMLLIIGNTTGAISTLATNIGYINSFLAMFNLLPISPLDGSKIFSWNKKVWLGILIISFVLIGMF